jgi:hypothetical protein
MARQIICHIYGNVVLRCEVSRYVIRFEIVLCKNSYNEYMLESSVLGRRESKYRTYDLNSIHSGPSHW